MSGKKEPIKVSLKVAIGLILTLLILIALISMYFLNMSNKPKAPETNNVTTNEVSNEKPEIDFNSEMLKLNNKKENMIFSPLSIKYALSMLRDGANNQTRQQMDDVLGDNKLTKYENIEKVLSLANSVFVKDDFKNEIDEDYINTLKDNYDAEFRFDKFESAKNINDWIEDKTFGIIKDIISDDAVKDSDLKLMIVNALAIDMQWAEEFEGKNTWGSDFHGIGENPLKVAMMSQTTSSNNIKYLVNDEITSVSMKLGIFGEEEKEMFDFVAIMPNETSLDKYIEGFSSDNFEKILDDLKPASKAKNGINLSIPRFDYDYTIPLVENLQKLGVKDVFNPVMADLSNIVEDKSLYVNDAIHKADIEFTEKGTKAAAVTAFFVLDSMAIMDEEKPIEVKFNKPFMYVIRDIKTGEVWFMGTVYEPVFWVNVESDYR